MIDVTLINAPVRLRNEHARLSPPLGLAYLGASLREAGFSVSAIDFNVSGYNPRRVVSMLSYEEPRLVGISATTETYPQALAIAADIKERKPETYVVLGGAHPTILPAEVMGERDIDFVIVGPGEQAIVDLARAVLQGEGGLAGVAGLAYRDAEGAVVVNERAELPHPDELPRPARDLFVPELYKDKWNIVTATGSCPYRCPFCSASSLWKGRRRMRTPSDIAAEIDELWRDFGVDRVFFTDDIFTLNRRWVGELLDEIEKLNHAVQWGCATRVDAVDVELIARMAAVGCDGIQFGVESGAQDILDSVKGIDKQQVRNAVSAAVAHGIDTVCSFMIPFPEDTAETLAESLAFMAELRGLGARIFLSYTCPYPGTAFYEKAEELGLTILSDDFAEYDAKHVILETKNLTAEEITTAAESMAEALSMKKSDLA